jgi:hypothetical protein
MPKFYGTVISGERAGEFHCVESPYLALPNCPEVKPFYVEEVPLPDTYKVYRYKHVKMQWRNDATGKYWLYGFWVPLHIEDPQPFIIDTLLKDYRK